MVDVSSMSDAELRTKLIEFGFPVMPITGTTRKVMEKKLKILMENKNKVTSEGRRSLARYSSEEESDVDIKLSKKDKAKRATMAAPPSRGVTLRKSTRKADTDSDNETRKPILSEEKKVATRIIKITQAETGFDTGSDSESEILEKSYKSNVNNHDFKTSFIHSPVASTVSSSSYLENTRKYSPPKVAEDVVTKPVSVSYTNSQSPSRYSSYGSSASDYAADRLNQIRSRLSLGATNYDRPLYSSTINTTLTTEKEEPLETPFLSNFTKRLSQLSNSSLKVDDYKNDIIKEHDVNGSGSFPTRTYLPRPVKRDFTRDYQSGKQTNTQNNLVSFAVIALAFLFFILLAIAYMGLHSGETAVESPQSDLKVSYCDTAHTLRPEVNCIYSVEVRDAVRIYEIIKSELLKRAIDNRCLNSKIKSYMTESEIGPYAERMSTEHIKDINKSIRNMEILALTNPQWDVSLLKITDNVLDDMPIRGFDDLYNARESGTIVLSILNPSLPWSCSIYNKFTAIFQTVVILAFGFLTVYSINTGYKYYKHYQQKQNDELHYMVERIIDSLQTNATDGGDNYLVINHVRDMILPINDRARMEKTWRKAVDFINKNESRVRTEEQVVQGEPYEVWRWLGSPNLNMSGSPRNKSWQGQAFETQVGSVNSLPCSPTPCLKIRGMVDDGDRNLLTIREAVLSKCAHQCRILHCAVDTNSKCVYLKCADQNDAAIAYRSLHGWWYAGNLVTVKYLRLERYMQRYPDSPVSGPPYMKAVQPATDWSN